MLPIKRTARQRLQTYANISRIQTDEETYDLERTAVGSVVAGATADRCGKCGACDRTVVPVDVGDRETYDMAMTLLERWDEYDWCSSYMPKKEIRRCIAIAQAVENKANASPVFRAYAKEIYGAAEELLEESK